MSEDFTGAGLDHEEPQLPDPPNTPWGDRVAYSRRGGGFAYDPQKILCADAAGRDFVVALVGDRILAEPTTVSLTGERPELGFLVEVNADVGVLDVIDDALAAGHHCEPDFVFFATSGGCGCGCGAGGNPVYGNPVYGNPVYGNPVYGNPVYGNPVYGNPVYGNAACCAGGSSAPGASGPFGNPVYANPVYASPVYGNPVYGNPVYANAYICDGKRMSTARPASDPAGNELDYQPQGRQRVIVLDSGIAPAAECPQMLLGLVGSTWPDPPDGDGDQFLDPVAGHGTFIAGIVQMLAPNRQITMRRVMGTQGEVDVLRVVQTLELLDVAGLIDEQTVINMSFGGYADRDIRTLAIAIRGVRRRHAVVVASAGNDGTCRPAFPACFTDVVAVAALDESMPAAYSNYGSWVQACAPGTDLVSAFFAKFKGQLPPLPGGGDPDDFASWARWTGTSFAAPVVVAALAREMERQRRLGRAGSAEDAVREVIDAPGLFRIPGYGTVVNLTPAHVACT